MFMANLEALDDIYSYTHVLLPRIKNSQQKCISFKNPGMRYWTSQSVHTYVHTHMAVRACLSVLDCGWADILPKSSATVLYVMLRWIGGVQSPYPTELLKVLKPHSWPTKISQPHEVCRSVDFESWKLRIVWSGIQKLNHPTGPFTILKPHDQENGKLYVVQERHTTDFKALKLSKGQSGMNPDKGTDSKNEKKVKTWISQLSLISNGPTK